MRIHNIHLWARSIIEMYLCKATETLNKTDHVYKVVLTLNCLGSLMPLISMVANWPGQLWPCLIGLNLGGVYRPLTGSQTWVIRPNIHSGFDGLWAFIKVPMSWPGLSKIFFHYKVSMWLAGWDWPGSGSSASSAWTWTKLKTLPGATQL